MLTVPQAAKRTGRHPETIRRWIREGRLRASKVGTQHLIEDADLEEAISAEGAELPIPAGWWDVTLTGEPVPAVVAAVRSTRRGH